MKANIFIPISRDSEQLVNCLKSLSEQSDQRFSVIAVSLTDNDHIKKLLKKYIKDYLFLVQPKRGLLHAANLALNHAKDDIFIRIDDDIVADKNWLKAILTSFEDKKVGGVTGPTIIKKKLMDGRDLFAFLNDFEKSTNPLKKLLSYLYTDVIYEGKMKEVSLFTRSGAFTLGSNFEESVQKIGEPKSVDNLEACNFAVRRTLLEEFGGFDPTFAQGLSEYHEADVACKITEAGYTNVFNPQAQVFHNVQKSAHVRVDSYHRIQNFIIFYRKHLSRTDSSARLRFLFNVLLQNCYYIFLFMRTGKRELLGAIPGSIVGLFRPI
ncbi:glycosyltransferase [Candidatus Roizmanbacteria bacterium]|nr:MAG: glycosyltransferase [Candidatus Roizmanbacteria bacterium]